MSSNKIRTGIGLALIGCGDIGKARAQFARMYPAVEWIGVCDVNLELAKLLAEEIHADFVTNDASELLSLLKDAEQEIPKQLQKFASQPKRGIDKRKENTKIQRIQNTKSNSQLHRKHFRQKKRKLKSRPSRHNSLSLVQKRKKKK